MNITVTLENPYYVREELKDLNEAHYSEDLRKDITPLNIDWDELCSMYNAGLLLGFIIRDDTDIVGYSTVTLQHDLQTDAVLAFMNTLFVKEDYRGKGVASALIVKVESTLKEAEVDYFSIGFRNEDKADKLMESLGFCKSEILYAKNLRG